MCSVIATTTPTPLSEGNKNSLTKWWTYSSELAERENEANEYCEILESLRHFCVFFIIATCEFHKNEGKKRRFFWVRSLRHLKYIAMVVPKQRKSAEKNFFHVAFSFYSAANMIKTPTTALSFWHRRDDDTSARFVLIIAIINFYFYDSPRAIKVNLINSHFPLWTDDY